MTDEAAQTTPGQTTPGQTATLSSAAVWMAGAYALSLIFQILANALAGRALGTADFGTFASCMTLAIIVGQVALLGYQVIALRDAARLAIKPDDELAALNVAAMRSLDRLILPSLGILTGLAAVLWKHPSSPADDIMLLLGIAGLVAVGAQQNMHAAYLRGFGEVRISSFLIGRSGGTFLLGAQALAIGVVAALVSHPSPAALIAGSAVAVLPTVILSRVLVYRHFSHIRPPWNVIADLKQTINRSRGFAALQVGTMLDLNVDILIASAVLSRSDASLFSAAQRIAIVIIVPTALAQIALGPTLARSAEDPRTAERIARSTATITTIVAAVTLAPLCIVPGRLLGAVYGPGFSHGSLALALLGFGYFLRVTTGMAAVWMSMTGMERTAARIFWVGLVCRVVIGGAAGFFGGLTWLTVVSVLVTAGVFWSLWFCVRRRASVRTDPLLIPDIAALRRARG